MSSLGSFLRRQTHAPTNFAGMGCKSTTNIMATTCQTNGHMLFTVWPDSMVNNQGPNGATMPSGFHRPSGRPSIAGRAWAAGPGLHPPPHAVRVKEERHKPREKNTIYGDSRVFLAGKLKQSTQVFETKQRTSSQIGLAWLLMHRHLSYQLVLCMSMEGQLHFVVQTSICITSCVACSAQLQKVRGSQMHM